MGEDIGKVTWNPQNKEDPRNWSVGLNFESQNQSKISKRRE